MSDECEPQMFLSCVCMRGTKCCNVKHGCNRHIDCRRAQNEFATQYPKGKPNRYGGVQNYVECCHDGSCEECFGY